MSKKLSVSELQDQDVETGEIWVNLLQRTIQTSNLAVEAKS